MKKFALAIAFALLAAVPSSAAEISAGEIFQAAPAMTPAMTPINQTQEAIPLLVGPIKPIPRCYTVEGTSCSTTGAFKACTDVCHNALSCECYERWGGTYGTTFLGRFWDCFDEC
jgi:hypothetical protein